MAGRPTEERFKVTKIHMKYRSSVKKKLNEKKKLSLHDIFCSPLPKEVVKDLKEYNNSENKEFFIAEGLGKTVFNEFKEGADYIKANFEIIESRAKSLFKLYGIDFVGFSDFKADTKQEGTQVNLSRIDLSACLKNIVNGLRPFISGFNGYCLSEFQICIDGLKILEGCSQPLEKIKDIGVKLSEYNLFVLEFKKEYPLHKKYNPNNFIKGVGVSERDNDGHTVSGYLVMDEPNVLSLEVTDKEKEDEKDKILNRMDQANLLSIDLISVINSNKSEINKLTDSLVTESVMRFVNKY